MQASRLPAKRNLVFRPGGGPQLFQCTVCAVVANTSRGVILGIDIRDSFETTAHDLHVPQRKPADSSSVTDPSTDPVVPVTNAAQDWETATEFSDGTEDSEVKSTGKVAFDIRPSCKRVQDQADQATSYSRRARKLALTNFRIDPSGISITGRYGTRDDASQLQSPLPSPLPSPSLSTQRKKARVELDWDKLRGWCTVLSTIRKMK